MAYSTTTPPIKLAQSMSGPSLWWHSNADVDSDVDAADYFSNGDDLGMVVGDILFHFDTAGVMTPFFVSAVTAGGAATVISQQFV